MMNFSFMPYGWIGWLFMLIVWVLIIAGIVTLIKWLFGQFCSQKTCQNSALEILKERYARGEINKKEFEAKKKNLI